MRIGPFRGQSAIRSSAASIASRNSAPRRGRCSSNQTAAAASSSSASAENSIGNVTERGWNGSAHGPQATGGPDPLLTPHVERAVRVRPPRPLEPRPDHRAHHGRDWPGDRRRTPRGDWPEGSARRAAEHPGRSSSPPRISLASTTHRRPGRTRWESMTMGYAGGVTDPRPDRCASMPACGGSEAW